MCIDEPQPKPKQQRKQHSAATSEHGLSPSLITARADYSHSSFAAWSLVILATSSFYLGPLILLTPLFLYFSNHSHAARIVFIFNLFLAFYPIKPWMKFRKTCQVFYSIFNVHHNFMPELNEIAKKENRLVIFAQHPHAIIPLHGFVWGAICDQLLPNMYGYGCTTDGALVLPVLRHMLYWISAGSAQKKKVLNEMQTRDRNLWILPGGVAEIFLSHRREQNPGGSNHQNVQTIKARRYGLMKLALETGAVIYPSFVFGASDMLDQLATADNANVSKKTKNGVLGNVMESISRKIGGGLTLYYGQYYLPVPYNPQMSIVLGNPIYPTNDKTMVKNISGNGNKMTCKRVVNPSTKQVEDLMERYVDALHCLFEQYKEEAGYPNDTLRII